MKVAAVHWFDRTNVGDQNCGPAAYFDLPGRVERIDLDDKRSQKRSRARVVVFGGGSYPKRLRKRARFFRAARRVAWGVGHTIRGVPGPMPQNVHADVKGFALYGHRDWGCKGDYVPCVSCMSPHFDQAGEPEHEVVFFGHPQDGPLEGCAPRMLNDELDMGRVVQFLASGETVVTASYHGAYWATLLGRKVVALPYSAKFWHLKYPPVLTDDWREGVKRARRYDGVLEECRALNTAFHTRVLGVMS